MSLRSSLLALSLICFIPFTTFSQTDLLALNPSLPVHTLTIDESLGQGGVNPDGARAVSIPVQLHTESAVKIEIRDALGMKRFESEGTYPEGEREIRIGMGSMDQGLYFVRVSTYWEEKTEIVIVERIH